MYEPREIFEGLEDMVSGWCGGEPRKGGVRVMDGVGRGMRGEEEGGEGEEERRSYLC